MKYQVIIQDEWNNLYHIGFYDKLENSLKDINSFLFDCYDVTITELVEYPLKWSTCFDKEIKIDPSTTIYIKGFIFNKEILRKELKYEI